jgi:hypothetical protein
LRGGQQVVTAGVNQLKPGQKVTILNAPEGSLPATKSAASPALASNVASPNAASPNAVAATASGAVR